MRITVENVTKCFNDIPAVSELDMSIDPGKIVGLLGPNGAGKTTTLRMILDIFRPDKGKIKFDGKKFKRKFLNQIGYLPEERGIYQRYKVSDVLVYFGRLKNLSKRKSGVEAVRLLDRFNLIDYVDEQVGHLSKGMQQKLQFIISVLHNPDILIFDEPFRGLDPFNQEIVRKYIKGLKNENKAILLSTHQLGEAEALCDMFVLVDTGRVVLQGSLEEIREGFREKILVVEASNDLKKLQSIHNIERMTIKNSRAFLEMNEKNDVKKIMNEVIKTVDVSRIEIVKPSLQDIFLKTIQVK